VTHDLRAAMADLLPTARDLLRGVLLLLSVVLVGCTTSTQSASIQYSTSPSPTIAPAPATCPQDITANSLKKNDVAGMTESIVPGDPQVLVICDSPPMGDGESLRVVLTDSNVVGQFADELNGMKLTPFNECPTSYGPPPEVGLFFNYAAGDVLLVKVEGCPIVTNGQSAAVTTPSIWRLLHTTERDASA
jgi:hypothetical protein